MSDAKTRARRARREKKEKLRKRKRKKSDEKRRGMQENDVLCKISMFVCSEDS